MCFGVDFCLKKGKKTKKKPNKNPQNQVAGPHILAAIFNILLDPLLQWTE